MADYSELEEAAVVVDLEAERPRLEAGEEEQSLQWSRSRNSSSEEHL